MSQIAAPRSETTRGNAAYAWYVVGLLVLAYTFSFIDRQILTLLVEPMKEDLKISDTKMSLLYGIAFGIFYTFMGLPIGRLVDTKNRVAIISVGVFLWSLMTALCGIARNYWQLFAYRMGVGVGEAALTPAAYSIISDYFKPERLGFALGIYSVGIYVGAGLALIIGGIAVEIATSMAPPVLPFFGEIYDWQLVFLMVGLPGIPLALWVWTLREPKRSGVSEADLENAVPWSELYAYMKANRRTLICHHMSYAMVATMAYGAGAWIPSFYIRTYGWTAGEAGVIYGIVVLICGSLGVASGGWIGDWLTAKGYRDGKMRVHLICPLASIPFAIAAPLMPDPWLATLFLIPSTLTATLLTGNAAAGLQDIMPNRMRGIASAVLLFVVNIFGLGLGSTLIALCTDYVFGDAAMLRYSLVIVPTIILTLACFFAVAGFKPYRESRDYYEKWISLRGAS